MLGLYAFAALCRLSAHTPSRSLENQVLRDGERDMYIKQTYSVLRNDVNQEEGAASGSTPSGSGGPTIEKKDVKKKPRKWHLSECPFPMQYFVHTLAGQEILTFRRRRRNVADPFLFSVC